MIESTTFHISIENIALGDRLVPISQPYVERLAAFPDARHGGDRRKKKQEGQNVPLETKRFTASVADKVGWDERTIKRRLQLANSLDIEAVSLARSTGLIENASQMLKLAAFPHAKQMALMQCLRDRGCLTIGAAEYLLGWRVAKPPRSPADRLIESFGNLLVTATLDQLEAMKCQLDARILQIKKRQP